MLHPRLFFCIISIILNFHGSPKLLGSFHSISATRHFILSTSNQKMVSDIFSFFNCFFHYWCHPLPSTDDFQFVFFDTNKLVERDRGGIISTRSPQFFFSFDRTTKFRSNSLLGGCELSRFRKKDREKKKKKKRKKNMVMMM